MKTIFYIKGQLVDVYLKDEVIKSSTRRDDLGACEVVYVTNIKVKRSAYRNMKVFGGFK